MNEELKPVKCGCGGEPSYYDDRWRGCCGIQCMKCGIDMSNCKSREEAIRKWNTAMGERTAKVETYTDDQQETWSVCECGTDVWKSYNYCPECGARLE